MMLLRYTTPNQVGFVTVTAVELSGDLQVAKVYITTQKAPKEVLTNLRAIAPKIAHELAQKFSMRRVPEVRFAYDESKKLFQNLT